MLVDDECLCCATLFAAATAAKKGGQEHGGLITTGIVDCRLFARGVFFLVCHWCRGFFALARPQEQKFLYGQANVVTTRTFESAHRRIRAWQRAAASLLYTFF